MSFSNEWDEQYRNNNHMSVWPWSQLVSLCLRHTQLGNRDPDFYVLEVGCGAGANIPFFLSYTDNVFALDGSTFIIDALKKRFSDIEGNFLVSDFTKEIPFEKTFDLIVDRGASVHNETDSIEQYLELAYQKLKPGGNLVITDWFSTEHGYFEKGVTSDTSEYTKSDYTSGPFANVGNVHFFDKKEIQRLTAKFKICHLEHSITKVDGIEEQGAAWHLVLEKIDA